MTTCNIITGDYSFCIGDAARLPLADKSVDLVLGSPPYCDARTYDDGTLPEGRTISMGVREWVDWMLIVTREALRVSRGPVIWVAAGVTRDRNYWPACEGLMWEAYKAGIEQYRPVFWHRVGIPGSGGDDWFRADVEYCMAFKHPGALPWSDNTAMGHPPKWAPGGACSHRLSDGTRKNQWGGSEKSTGGERKRNGQLRHAKVRPSHRIQTKRDAKGNMQTQSYGAPVMANPGTLLRTTTGGGQLGSDLAHDNEAPYPERVPEFFVRSLCPPGGIVCDPFSGSGTTVSVAVQHGRRGIGFDLRSSQVKLGYKRVRKTLRPETFRDMESTDVSPLFATPN